MVSPNIPCHYIFLLCLVSYNTFLFWLKVVLFFYFQPINWLNWSCRLPTLEAKVLIVPQSIIRNIYDIQSPTHGLQSILVNWICVESNWISSEKICYITSFVLLRNTFEHSLTISKWTSRQYAVPENVVYYCPSAEWHNADFKVQHIFIQKLYMLAWVTIPQVIFCAHTYTGAHTYIRYTYAHDQANSDIQNRHTRVYAQTRTQ